MLIFVFGINYYQDSRIIFNCSNFKVVRWSLVRLNFFSYFSPNLLFPRITLHDTCTENRTKCGKQGREEGGKLVESSDFSIHVGQRARLYPTRTLYPCASFRALINGTKIILKATENSYRGLAAIRERQFQFFKLRFRPSKRFETCFKETKI